MGNECCGCGCVLIKECDIYENTPLREKNLIFKKKDIIKDVHVLKVKPLIPDCYDAICAKVTADGIDSLEGTEKEIVDALKEMISKWIFVFWLEAYGDGEYSEGGFVDGQYDDGLSHVSSRKLEKKISRATTVAIQYEKDARETAVIMACNKKNICLPCGTSKNNAPFNNLERL